MEDVDSPLLDVRPVKTVLLVSVTGDRGLCGGYNNQIIKKARPRSQLQSVCKSQALLAVSECQGCCGV